MNCKQGDLAIVVKTCQRKNFHLLGRVVQCEEPRHDFWGNSGWLVSGIGLELLPFLNECLRQIRDSDREDETLQWLPVPTKETA